MFELILKGDEKKVIEIYRKIYDQGVEPKVFINDFIELIYYFKNINSLTLESTNFSLNDTDFSKIKEISNKVDNQVLILFWQFTIRTIEELDIVSNQNLSMEMFLIRLIHIASLKKNLKIKIMMTHQISMNHDLNNNQNNNDIKNNETINQIKEYHSRKKLKPELKRIIK